MAGGATTMLGFNVPSDTRTWEITTSVVSTAASGTAIRGGRAYRPANSSGIAHHVALGARASRTTQTAETAPSQTRCRVVGAEPGAGAGARTYPRT